MSFNMAAMVVVHYLPLGIPFLSAYLDKNGHSADVLDLNMAYLKRIPRFWILYRLNKWYHSSARDVSRGLKKASGVSGEGKSKKKKKAILSFYSLVNKKISELLDYRKPGGRLKRSIPWSLESIINFDAGSGYGGKAEEIHKILRSIIKKIISRL